MGNEISKDIPSYPILLILITVYYLILMKIIHSYKGTQAVFCRSYTLIVLSSIINYLETIFSIIVALTYTTEDDLLNSAHLGLTLTVILLNEGFYISNLQKVFRVIHLIKLSTGDFKLEKSFFIKRKLTMVWNMRILIGFIIITLVPRILVCLLLVFKSLGKDEVVLILRFMQIGESSIESLILLWLVTFIIKSNCDITLRIEYSLYLSFWFFGYSFLFQPRYIIFSLSLPIRNMVMMLVNTVSIYEHDKNFFLPLPDDIDLDFVLKSQFFVNRIRDHLIRIGDKKMKFTLDALLALCIYRDSQNDEEKTIVLEKIKKLEDTNESLINFSSDFYEFQDIFLDLYKDFDENFFRSFIRTEDFYEIQIDYSSL